MATLVEQKLEKVNKGAIYNNIMELFSEIYIILLDGKQLDVNTEKGGVEWYSPLITYYSIKLQRTIQY